MPRRLIYTLAGLISFTGWMIFGSSLLEHNMDNVQRLIPERPAYVPETAVYRTVGQTWIDIQPSADGIPNHFTCAIYNVDTAAQALRADLMAHPEIDGMGKFVLEGEPTDLKRVRRLVHFYDGMDIYMRDGRMMVPAYN